MPLVSSVDYVQKRIFLSVETVNADLDTIDVYKEVRALRRLTELHRQFQPMIIGGGNIEKIPGVSATPAYVQLLNGCRIVPFDSTHLVKLIRDTFTDDGFAGRDCFDRSSLSPGVVVDIDVDFPEIEIRFAGAGGGGTLDTAVEGSLSHKDVLRILLAAAAGRTDIVHLGAGNAEVRFKSVDATRNRILAQMTGSKRITITLDPA